jgi:hypothetical protein
MRPVYHLLAFALVSGCLATPAHPAGGPGPGAVDVLVANDGGTDVDVYAYRDGQRFHVGFVSAHSSIVVHVPPGMYNPGHVQIMVHPLTGGTRDFVADEVAVSDNDHAELRVRPALDESVISVVPGRIRR